ncbi:hypothetical protein EAS61_35470 [Bradyrhizobium zhanjiangense]|uniref:Uncharacterized protein n=1 Tax=Bradyrhizobium zhanjiangense TaxID=1325107 RepID=A0A4Q0Q9J1_9BRAD|nr:hypothetical protein EAS61_35470 [Bradyrhizobium zhanjiangense]
MTGISMSKQIHFDAERPAPSWDWQKAVDKFLDHIRTKRAPDTYDDYARTLGAARLGTPQDDSKPSIGTSATGEIWRQILQPGVRC